MASNVPGETKDNKTEPMGSFRATPHERKLIAVAAAHKGERIATFLRKAGLDRALAVLSEVQDHKLTA